MNALNEKVMVYIPARDGMMSLKTCVGLVQSQGVWDLFADDCGASFIPKLKAQACWLAQKHGVDRLVLIDADIEFKGQEFARLANHDCDIVGGLYTRTVIGGDWVVRTLNGEPYLPEDGLVEVDAVGGGFMSIRTNILPIIAAKLRSFQEAELARIKTLSLAEIQALTLTDLRKLFDLEVVEFRDGDNLLTDFFPYRLIGDNLWTDDFLFCKLARAAGFKVMLDASLHVRHRGGHSFCGMETMLQPPPMPANIIPFPI